MPHDLHDLSMDLDACEPTELSFSTDDTPLDVPTSIHDLSERYPFDVEGIPLPPSPDLSELSDLSEVSASLDDIDVDIAFEPDETSLNHAFFKALLFLAAGAVSHSMDNSTSC
ncbi:hypothetical protein A1Q2_02361 [Trichosporon asahii var. asahii CBS 8904]|uniref:Uncharacterized protein n=1 Tax=Trichosporon asahii var. asahii (strain CBS 8904) TaxID=1220162 RepID=K1VV00_TRIAC|nr:hypothetical protein A1Q2_02361 [Trichosporon asahii var. asahii CBS 8904]